MYNIFLLSKKKFPFEQYYRLHAAGSRVAICETTSNNVFVLPDSSFEQNNFVFLHALQEVVDVIKCVLQDFGYNQIFEKYDSVKHPTHPIPSHPFYSK